MASDVSSAWSDTNGVGVSSNPPSVRSLTPVPDLLLLAEKNGGKIFNIILSGVNNQIPKSDPRTIKTELTQKIVPVEKICDVRQTRFGCIFISTTDASCAAAVYNISEFLGHAISARIIWDSFTNKFLLHDIPADVPLEELAKEIVHFNEVNILELRRFRSKGLFPPVLVTSLGTGLPREIKVWFRLHPICQFIDRPRQCIKCYQFNHATAKCQSTQLCISCGSPHEGQCPSPLKCVNCGSSHRADSKECPARLQEERLLEFKSHNFLSLAEARRRFTSTNSHGSYARVAQSPAADSNSCLGLLQPIQDLLTGYANVIIGSLREFIIEQTEQLKEWMSSLLTQAAFCPTFSRDLPPEEESPSGTTDISRPSSPGQGRKRNKKKRKAKDSGSADNCPKLPIIQQASERQGSTSIVTDIGDTCSQDRSIRANSQLAPQSGPVVIETDKVRSEDRSGPPIAPPGYIYIDPSRLRFPGR